MIQIYTGTPGSGKSLHLAKDIHFWLKMGINIIANFEINKEYVKKCKGKFTFVETEDITVKFLQRYALENHDFISRQEFQTQIIIDECSDIFNCRDFSRKDRPEWLKFFRQHRKYRYDILLTTQDDREVDRQIRNKIEEEVKHRKLNNFGIIGTMMSMLSLNKLKLFVAIKFWKGNAQRTGVDYFIYRKKYGELYDTFKIFSDDDFKKLIKDLSLEKGMSGAKGTHSNEENGGIQKNEKSSNNDISLDHLIYHSVTSSTTKS